MSKGAIKDQKAQARQKQMRANLLGHNLLTVSMYNAAQQQAEAQQREAANAAAGYDMRAAEVYDYHQHFADVREYAPYRAHDYSVPPAPMAYLAAGHTGHAHGIWTDSVPPATYDASMGLGMYASDYQSHQSQAAPDLTLPPLQAQPQLFGWHEDREVPSRHVDGLADEGLIGDLSKRDEGLEDFESSVQQANGW